MKLVGTGSRRIARTALEEREEALRGLCFCLLYDLFAWLVGAQRPVPDEVLEYRVEAARGEADPGQRLRRYLDPALADHWERALAPFFESGASLSMELGETAPLGAEGLRQREGEVRVELRFSEQSSLLDGLGRPHPLPRRDWVLEAWVSSGLDRVENARLRPAGGTTGSMALDGG
jgi:hypothetical protein